MRRVHEFRGGLTRRWFGPNVRIGRGGRFTALVVAGACIAALGLARYLVPSPAGYGTHEALGMPPCSFIYVSGLPCPTCGMTTAFSLTMHGHVATAFVVQPAGALMCWATVIVLGFALHAAATGRVATFRWERLGPVRFLLLLGFVFLGAWGFKIFYGLATGELPAR